MTTGPLKRTMILGLSTLGMTEMATAYTYCPLSRALRKAKFGHQSWHTRIDQTVTRLENTKKAFGDDQYKHSGAYRVAVQLLLEVTGDGWDRTAEKVIPKAKTTGTAAPLQAVADPQLVKTPEELAADAERRSKLTVKEVEGTIGNYDPNGQANPAAMPPAKHRLM